MKTVELQNGGRIQQRNLRSGNKGEIGIAACKYGGDLTDVGYQNGPERRRVELEAFHRRRRCQPVWRDGRIGQGHDTSIDHIRDRVSRDVS